MERIFISYKRVDKDKVFKIRDFIEQQVGVKCWIDLDGIESDAQFKNVIIKAIKRCEIVLFMYSNAHTSIVNFEKDWTFKELNFASDKGKRIVFINLDGTPLTDEFSFDYGLKQQIDARNQEALKRLVRDIRKWLKMLEQEGRKEVGSKSDSSDKKSDSWIKRACIKTLEFICDILGWLSDIVEESIPYIKTIFIGIVFMIFLCCVGAGITPIKLYDVVCHYFSSSKNEADESPNELYMKGYELYEQENYTEAFKYFQKASEQGQLHAQYYLGNLYYNGKGVEQDYSKAREWFLNAAEQGDDNAQNGLGSLYYDGKGVAQDYAKAREWYMKAAEQGHLYAQNHLGNLYYNGKGVEQDYSKAREWYLKAAEQGNADAQNSLGNLYYHGNGVTQDYVKAREWYLKAAEQGNANAQNNLGNLYNFGKGVTQDYANAREWYLKAAKQGYANAQNHLGNLYYHGNGVTQDYVKAREWYLKAAEQGNARAQKNLGSLYYDGKGVTQDYQKALEWYKKAADNGSEEGKKSYERLKNSM